MVPYRFFLLGDLRVTHGGETIPGPPYRAHSLLAALLLHPGLQRRNYLLGLLYPDLPESVGRKRLSDMVWLLRHALPDLPLRASVQELGLQAEARWLDVEAFGQACAGDDLSGWLGALALYQGDLLESVYDDWLLVEREALYLRYVHVLYRTCRSLLDTSRFDELLPLVERLVREEPYDETALRLLMRAYQAVGRRGRALAAYEHFLSLADGELRVDPDPRTQALAREIRDVSLPIQPGVPHDLPKKDDPEVLFSFAQRALARGDLPAVDECLRRMRMMPDAASDGASSKACLIEIDRALFCEELDAAERLLETCSGGQAAVLVREARLAMDRRQAARASRLAQQALAAVKGGQDGGAGDDGAEDDRAEDGGAAQVDALLVLSQAQQHLGQGVRAARSLEQALALAGASASSNSIVRALVIRGYAAIRQGRYAQALTSLQEARGLAHEHGLGPSLGEALRGIGIVRSYQGALVDAQRILHQELSIWRDLGLQGKISSTLHNLAYIQAQLGRTADSMRTLEQARPLCERSGDPVRVALNQYHLAETMLYHDDVLAARAQALISQALDTFRAREQPGWEAAALSTLGRALWLQGQHGAAGDALRQACDLYEQLDELAFLPELLAFQALASLGLGEQETALELSREALLSLAQGEVSGETAYEVYYAHGMALVASGEADQARDYLSRAYQSLLDQAAQLGEEAARQAFFQHSPTARRLMGEVYARQIVPPPSAGQIDRQLPSPRGRELVNVRWTLDAGPPDAALKQARGAIALRRARLTRLLEEAAVQGAQPTIAQLSEALGVSRRTLQRDLAALRAEQPSKPPIS